MAERRVADIRLSFEPADIVNEVMSFGSPTPIEVVVSGPKMADNRAYAEKVYRELAKVPSLVDLQYAQALDYPTVEVRRGPREAGRRPGRPPSDVARAVTPFTSSSRFTVPNYWRDPASGDRLPGAGRGPVRPGELGQGPGTRPGRHERGRPGAAPRRGAGEGRDDARPDRPVQHAAAGEHDREHPGRRPRRRGPAGGEGGRGGRAAAGRGAGGRPRAGRPDATNCSAGLGVRAGWSRSS